MSVISFQTSTHQSGAIVAALTGELGMTEIEDAEKELEKIVEKKPKLVVLDMSKLTLMVSMGMDALVTFHRHLEKAGGKVRLAALQPMVKDSLQRAKLIGLFSIHDSVDAALAG